MSVQDAYQLLYIIVLLMLGALIAVMLIRSVTTKGVMERILCVNMLSTMVICMIAILSRMLNEPYLVDVAVIYAMISFVTVLMLSLTHIPPGKKRARFMAARREGGAGADGRRLEGKEPEARAADGDGKRA